MAEDAHESVKRILKAVELPAQPDVASAQSDPMALSNEEWAAFERLDTKLASLRRIHSQADEQLDRAQAQRNAALSQVMAASGELNALLLGCARARGINVDGGEGFGLDRAAHRLTRGK